MFLQIDPANGVAVYDQIARQIKYAVADGALAAGDLIPSVRELARELTVNPNTVSRAYLELKREGVVETVPGAGMAVCAGAKRHCQTQRRALLADRLRAALAEAIQAGLQPDQIESLVAEQLKTLLRHQGKGDAR
ncbi:MAG: GntR family transcriptional regulator [Planctomycetales bacterium]|nr:GntR family transcriptional regulator [Planctomycetales bacterium]